MIICIISTIQCAHPSKRQTDLDYADVSSNKVCDDCCEHDLCNNVCTNYIDWNATVLPNTTVIDNPVTTDYHTTEISRTTASSTTLGISTAEKFTTKMQQTDMHTIRTEKSTSTTTEQTTTQHVQQTTTTASTTEATTITKGTTLGQ